MTVTMIYFWVEVKVVHAVGKKNKNAVHTALGGYQKSETLASKPFNLKFCYSCHFWTENDFGFPHCSKGFLNTPMNSSVCSSLKLCQKKKCQPFVGMLVFFKSFLLNLNQAPVVKKEKIQKTSIPNKKWHLIFCQGFSAGQGMAKQEAI